MLLRSALSRDPEVILFAIGLDVGYTILNGIPTLNCQSGSDKKIEIEIINTLLKP